MAKKNKNRESLPEIKPDKETLHKTDPQEEMRGPFSSTLREMEELFKKESKEELDKKNRRAGK